MLEIVIVEKPQSISWETIREILQQAHQAHFDAGIVMGTTKLTAKELEERVGEKGKCYVAMEGDQVVGTASIRFKECCQWYCSGNTAEQTLLAVLPSYQGRHIGTALTKACEEEAVRRNVGTICFDTAELNTRKIQMALKDQYRLVDYRFNNGHFSVEMMKWLVKCPYSKSYCTIRFLAKKTRVRLKRLIKNGMKRIS